MSDFSSRHDGPIKRPHLPVRKVFEACREQSDKTVVPKGFEWPMVDGELVVPGDGLYGEDGKYYMAGLVSFTFMKGESRVDMTDGTAWYFPEASELLTRTKPHKTLLDRDGVPIDVGDTVYLAVEGDELYGDEPLEVIRIHTDGYHAVEVRNNNGFIVNYDPNHFTHERPLKTADGKLIEVGDVYYGDTDGVAWRVLGLDGPKGFPVRCIKDGGNAKRDLKPEWLHAERPDSWERLREDARKSCTEYWGCVGIRCEQCPSTIDGKTPKERFSVPICARAKQIDLGIRAEELEGGELL